MPAQSSIAAIALSLTLLLPLGACSNSTLLQRAFSADPNASRWSNNDSRAELPRDFPAELRYQNAVLQNVNSITPANVAANNNSSPGSGYSTRWTTSDSSSDVVDFYRKLFQSPGWELTRQTPEGQLTARKQDLEVVVTLPQASNAAATPASPAPQFESDSAQSAGTTEFELQYAYGRLPLAANVQSNSSDISNPGDPDFIGPVAPSNSSATAEAGVQEFSDLNKAPQQLQSYLQDLAQLGILTTTTAGKPTSSTAFNPNQVVDRRTFARWLVNANNRIYRDRPARQIRLATSSSQPVFRDVPTSDPDYPYIQGLAEAGFLSSPLSGDNNQLLFRPNAPLTRETMLEWKVPIDVRQILPSATVDGVKQSWGFKDANRIDPGALQAILADYQNGDLANIRRLFSSTLLLQPKKAVTRAEAAAALWYIGAQGDGYSVADVIKGERQASNSAASTAEPTANSAAPRSQNEL